MKTTVGVLAAVLALGFGCARPDWIEQTLVTVDVTGTWFGTLSTNLGAREVWLDLEQEGPKIKGVLVLAMAALSSGPVKGPIVGNVAGDVFTFTQVNGDWKGELVVNGDEMTGHGTGPRRFSIFLRRVSPPRTPIGQ